MKRGEPGYIPAISEDARLAIGNARREGAAEERAAVVADLNAFVDGLERQIAVVGKNSGTIFRVLIELAKEQARRIESGEHVMPAKPPQERPRARRK